MYRLQMLGAYGLLSPNIILSERVKLVLGQETVWIIASKSQPLVRVASFLDLL